MRPRRVRLATPWLAGGGDRERNGDTSVELFGIRLVGINA